MSNDKKTKYVHIVPQHPDPVITSVALSDDSRVFMGRDNRITERRAQLLSEEFPHVEVSNPEDVDPDDIEDEIDHNPAGGGSSTSGTPTEGTAGAPADTGGVA